MGNTGSAIAQCLTSVALVVTGAAVAAASFGTASVVAGGLISAGVSGATTAITNCVQGKPASWKEWGNSTAIGAVTGLVGGALCAGAGGFAKGLTEGVKMAVWKSLAIKGGCIVAGSTISSVTCNTITNVWNGRKPFEGVGIAAGVGAVGGLFACAGAASFHSLKRSSTSWLAHPVTRHSAGVAIDTASSVVGGAVGAGLAGEDVKQAALLGLATGAAVGTLTTSVRCSSKKYIKHRQQLERAQRVEEELRHVDGVDFMLEQTTDRNDPLGHRDLEHVDRHHSQLKGRFDEPGHERVKLSSRYYDTYTANQVRDQTLPKAAKQINTTMAEKSPLLNTINTTDVANLDAKYEALLKQPSPVKADVRAAKRVAVNARRALAVVETRANLVDANRRFNELRASPNSAPSQIAAANQHAQSAHSLFDQAVFDYLGKQKVDVSMPRSCGYGYRNDSTRTREFNIKGATSDFRAVGRPDGSIAWREASSFPSNVQPRSRASRVVGQRWFAGDRMNRRQVARNVLTQRHAACIDRKEDEHFVGA
ncbi:unnamed protein product [Phytophthora fragariaefolia]|uniref:Unnamed protein product n=1 Tax=Phytophthora fragariaefolia TaxID=1490495 RepID=A0A9W6XSG3_9STRA|nr:unnamed protein product [Phytophthora fragariaefolia]